MLTSKKIGNLMVAIALGASAASVQAAGWSDTYMGYRFGADFHEVNNTQDVHKNVLQFTHASGNSLGQNFLNLDILQSSNEDPASGSDKSGATEFYLTYRNQIHYGKAFDAPLAFGPVKDVALTSGFDLNTKNTAVAPRKQLLVVGPTLKFDVPGFLDVSLLYGLERNHNAFGSEHKSMTFDPYYILSTAWGIPFNAGPLPMKFQGFLNFNGKKGKDYSGVETATETLMRTSLMVDVGQMAFGRKNTVWVGLGWEHWHNKFGNHDKPGVNTDTPTLQAELHF